MFLPDVILTLKSFKLCPRQKNPNWTKVTSFHCGANFASQRTIHRGKDGGQMRLWERAVVLKALVLGERERERRGVRTGKGAATVWVGASMDVTWRAGCSLSSTQLQCHLKVDPPQLQHFLSDGLGEEHLLVSRFYIPTGDFFFLTSTISLSLSVTLSLSVPA